MEPVVEVVDLRKKYGKVVAVDGISFAVGWGEIHIFEKLGVTDRTAAVTVANEKGILRLQNS